MKAEFASDLRCPACSRDGTLQLGAGESDQREVREGELRCAACGASFPVHRGVPELLHEPPEYILKEAAGLARFAERMRADGWDAELVRSLPEHDSGYWFVQATAMNQLFDSVPFKAGERIVDVGSNTCWAANRFAQRGLHAIALDIATVELQGLYTADYFLNDGVYFERVLGSMDAMPLASGSVDYVYCCEVLHHNDRAALRRTFGEIFRVLRPGGRLLMVNETLKTLGDPVGVHAEEVAEFEGNEHAHWAARYRWEAARAGLITQVMEPHYHGFFTGHTGPARTGPVGSKAQRLAVKLRRRAPVRRAYLEWLNDVRGGVSMNMVATKPWRFVGGTAPVPAPLRVARALGAGLLAPIDRRAGKAPPRVPRKPKHLR